MSILTYLGSFFYGETKPVINYPEKLENMNIKVCISHNDLIKVKSQLRPVTGVVPSPARNRPLLSKRKLHMLNIAQLAALKRVKLKHITPNTKKVVYKHRHPVLRELLEKHKPVY